MSVAHSPSRQGQITGIRQVAAAALAHHRLDVARLALLAHGENTTFRVDVAGGDRYVLRVHRITGTPGHPVRGVEQVRSELRWLGALYHDGFRVPRPVPSADGELVVVIDGPDGRRRLCVLLAWVPGRFVDAGLTPRHADRLGRLLARLHEHAARWERPRAFVRPRVGDVDDETGAHIERALFDRCGPPAAALAAAVMDLVRGSVAELTAAPGSRGALLIHGDLHQENVLFAAAAIGAIDFDDCGFGTPAYDIAVPLGELHGRAGYPALRAALLAGYRGERDLPIEEERHVAVFQVFRQLQLTMWFLEHRVDLAAPRRDTLVAEGLSSLERMLAAVPRRSR